MVPIDTKVWIDPRAEHDAVEPQSFQQRTAQRQHLRRIVAQAARKLDQVPATRPPVGRQRHQQRMLESGGARDVDAAPLDKIVRCRDTLQAYEGSSRSL